MAAVDPPPRREAPVLKWSASIDRIPEDARCILHRLAGELWGGDMDPSALGGAQLKGAMTNEVFRIAWPSGEGDPRKVLVRIYGQGVDIFFDRADETLSAVDLRDPEISALIAKKLRELHDIGVPGPRNVSLWLRLVRWLEEARGKCFEEKSK